MSEVKSFWCHEASNILCVRASDFDRVTAERDAALGREAVLREELAKAKKGSIYKHAALVSKAEALTAADEQLGSMKAELAWQESDNADLRKRVDVLEGVLRELRTIMKDKPVAMGRIDAALKPAERTNTSGKAHCPHDGICHTSNETCAQAMARVAQIEPAEGGGDEAMSLAQIAQFNDDHDGRPERDD